jgi:ribosomal-protein-alanine acetyltransferase
MRLIPALIGETTIRRAETADVPALAALEREAFSTDRMSRASLRRLVQSPSAALLVAEADGKLVAYAALLFRSGSARARLYSIAVMPEASGRGLGSQLLVAAEEEAATRRCIALHLEVREDNAAAIALYERHGYRRFGRYSDYYQDHADALRLCKRLALPRHWRERAPPYIHQTTEFTCGAASMMMALAWADRAWRPDPGVELALWREATTVYTATGPGGCDPYGIAVALRRRGLDAEIYASAPGPYFLDTVRSEDKRHVMRSTQQQFRFEAEQHGITTHLNPLDESGFIAAFSSGASAIVLVAGYHMVRRGVPHWVFAFGHDAGTILVHDPAAIVDDQGMATAAETYAVPWRVFERMTRFGREKLQAAIVIRKGPPQ